MQQQMTLAIPGNNYVYWIIGGALCSLAGVALDLVVSGAMAGEAAKWGGIGAAVGAGVGLISVARRVFSRR